MKSSEFAEIISSTKSIVLGSIRKNLFPEHVDFIDDVVQETYLRAFKALSKNQFRGDSEISTWLYQIARNESLRLNQKLKRKIIKEEKLKLHLTENSYEVIPAENENLFSTIYNLLNKLPFIYKSVIEKQLAGKSEKQIALELNISKGTVKSRVFRAKELLKKWIGK